MRFHVFQYTIPADPELAELNAFLASHAIATVNQQIVSTPGGPMLIFVVETVPSNADGRSRQGTAKPKIDYRDELTEEQFAVFSRLRDERKRIADAEGAALYNIFSNAQLAEMVRGRFTTIEQIASIDGLGKARVKKYADSFLPILIEEFSEDEESKE
jgi:superfamily II DNA helicase RecQ